MTLKISKDNSKVQFIQNSQVETMILSVIENNQVG